MFICRKYIERSTSIAFNKLAVIRRMFVESSCKSHSIAICHMRSTNDIERNRSQVIEIVQKAKDMNANVSYWNTYPQSHTKFHYNQAIKQFQFVFLPECCDYVGGNVPETLKLAQTIDGDTMQFYRNLSKANKVWLSIGGFHEKVPKTVSVHRRGRLILCDSSYAHTVL